MILERSEIVNYVQLNFESLRKEADSAHIRKLGTKCDALGQFCPSIITFKRDKGLRKGKFIKDNSDEAAYTTYEMNSDNEPIRMKKYNRLGCDLTYFFYKRQDFTYAVPLFRDTKNDYGTCVYKYLMKNEKISEYAEIENNQVIFEKYDYAHLEEGYFECDWCYYYNSSFSRISPSSIELFSNKLSKKKINIPSDDNIIIRISRYYYKIFIKNGKVNLIKEYECNNGEHRFIRNL